ncbi:probable tubulin polyglutamylase ttll-15 [Helicoverpa zea]|uniref:probable tubulin polyglutamylase ttll-15 n=1 Tax=Helicoverpa zea TaxID=7113 RepID=UPI001F5963FB|nr:probable tubulin polyglutamylase ttll-15 [Helicoverpa zea]
MDDENDQKIEEKEERTLNNNTVTKDKNTDTVQQDLDLNSDKYKTKPEGIAHTNIFLLVCIAGISLGILLQLINAVKRSESVDKDYYLEKPLKYWVYKNSTKANDLNGFLKHVHLVLNRVGYEKSTNETPWNLLWAFETPFNELNLRNLSSNQKLNHFPGTGFITSKVDLATSDSKYIPKAFRLPKNKNEFLKYAEQNKDAMFVQKYNTHRHVYLKNVSEIDMTSGKSFVQEYVRNPFLVDGHRFDIGVYVVLKSVNPLRVYWYKGDVLFRYCSVKYHPFDPANLEKYVVGDDYLPTWEVPSLAHTYTALGNTMKEAFDIYVRSMGKDPTVMWEEVQNAISEIFFMKEHHIIEALKGFASSENLFQMMRFDFLVDENLKVHLLEANMSPNLSSHHYPPNQLLYEQVLYNLFSLTGVTQENVKMEGDTKGAQSMISAQKNIGVFGEECRTICNDNCSALELCSLCKPCLDAKLKKSLLDAYSEFLHRGDFRRLVPPPMVPNNDIESLLEKYKHLSTNNRLLHLWYQGKCNQDITWCY